MTDRSTTHLVVIPSYNTGQRLLETVHDAQRTWSPVWVVLDGSTDGSARALRPLTGWGDNLRVLCLRRNQGKGAAVLHGIDAAARAGFTHALVMDADGQHPAACIPEFMAMSQSEPDAMILGRPVFDASAPALRVRGRKISNFWVNIETLWGGIDDSLCGFRVYPIASLRAVMNTTSWMRRFDFDPEAVVRLYWRGVRPICLPAPVRYFRTDEGGVSHFRYVRDNALLIWMHIRLMVLLLPRLASLLLRRLMRR